MTTVQQLQDQYEAAANEALTLQSRNVDPGTLAAAVNRATQLKLRLNNARSDAGLNGAIDRVTNGIRVADPRGGGRRWSSQFFSDENGFKWLEKTKHERSGMFTSPAVELMGATITEDAASGGDLVIADYQPGILPLPTRKLTVADLFAVSPTDSNAIAYMKETTFTNAAAAVAEGAAKPESTLIFDAVTDPVQKIATWIPATTEVLDDVRGLQAYIDTRLRHGLELTEEDQLLNGDGTPPNISGILDRAGLAADVARGADTNADAVLKQISAITTATSMSPDGIVMHPLNWRTIQLAKDANGQYYGDGPFSSPQRPTLWGLPVAVTTAVTTNTAIVGAFRIAARIFRRGGVRLHVSNSHNDFFTTNKVALLVEERLALAVYRPAAFGKVTGLS
jgi:HK97 family phage major capsid protein